MKKGKFIVLYGINNLGKTTQAKLLVERLNKNGHKAEYLKYPIYDLKPSGNILNNYLREGNIYGLSPREAQIVYTQNRTQYEKELIKKLESGVNIVAEDYTGTGLAWGIGSGVNEYFLKHLNSKLLREDVAFIFDGERFREATEDGHKHETNDELTNKVRQTHLKLAFEMDWVPINANKTIEEIHYDLWRYTKNIIENNTIDKDNKIDNFNRNTPANLKFTEKKDFSNIINNKGSQSQRPPHNLPISTNEHETDESLKIEKLYKEAKLPTREHSTDAGIDLYSSEYYTLFPGDITPVHTGIKMAIPACHVGLIWDKSGVAKQGIKSMGGVIDSDYRGEIIVLLKNLGHDIFNIIPGQKIAQMLIQKIKTPRIKEENINNDTKRGEGGFGSTGIY